MNLILTENNQFIIAREERSWQPVWDYGRFMRLPRRGAPRNDGVLNKNMHNEKLTGTTK